MDLKTSHCNEVSVYLFICCFFAIFKKQEFLLLCYGLLMENYEILLVWWIQNFVYMYLSTFEPDGLVIFPQCILEGWKSTDNSRTIPTVQAFNVI